MATADWMRVIDQAADIGVSLVQFIGGEPTLHPDLETLVHRSLGRAISVEVYTNLARVTDELWQLFEQPGVRLATSYYSSDAVEHQSITARDSHARTWANICETLRRGIRLRIGVVQISDDQHVQEAVSELRAAGVTDICIDRLRQVGRGVRDQAPDMNQLCRRCGEGVLAVTPDGDTVPCVFSRWLSMGNVKRRSLSEIYADAAEIRATLARELPSRTDQRCPPSDGGCGGPNPCIPIIGATTC